jgi:hypothetical protein
VRVFFLVFVVHHHGGVSFYVTIFRIVGRKWPNSEDAWKVRADSVSMFAKTNVTSWYGPCALGDSRWFFFCAARATSSSQYQTAVTAP